MDARPDEPRYRTARQIAGELGFTTEPEIKRFRDWLGREKGRGYNHTAPRVHWQDSQRATYDADAVVARWRNRRGRGRPPKNDSELGSTK